MNTRRINKIDKKDAVTLFAILSLSVFMIAYNIYFLITC